MAKKETKEIKEAQAPSPEFKANIGSQIMTIIGKPPRFDRVEVCPLFDSRYRVNIWVIPEDKKEKSLIKNPIITISYFVIIDSDGKLATTNPGLKKLYSE